MRIDVEQLVLRAPEPEDLEVMLSFENDPYLWEVGTATGPYSRFQMRQYITENQNDLFVDKQLRLMMDLPGVGVVGIIDLCTFDPRHNRAEVGILVRKDLRQKGIARRALQLIETHCFKVLGIHQLYAYVEKENRPCQTLFESQGYLKSGYLRQWMRTGQGYKDIFMYQKLNPFAESLS